MPLPGMSKEDLKHPLGQEFDLQNGLKLFCPSLCWRLRTT